MSGNQLLAAGAKDSAFGRLLKQWRSRRGLSQLDLALSAHTTQRHLSFIECGRAAPSRDMVLRICGTMDVPLRQQNALLRAAGYAPVWGEHDLSAPDLAMVDTALDYMLAQHEPYPAFVVDRRWNMLRANRGAAAMKMRSIGLRPHPFLSPEIRRSRALAAVPARRAAGRVRDELLCGEPAGLAPSRTARVMSGARKVRRKSIAT